jgi:dTMP kinase
MEALGTAFHQRVADGFAALAAADTGRWLVVDGDASEDEVAARVSAAVAEQLGRSGAERR